MIYHSTRDEKLTAAPARAVLEGIAPDGGLYVCDPGKLDFDWQGTLQKDTMSMAADILGVLLPDFQDMNGLVRASYLEDMIVREPLALKMAFGENPKRCYGSKNKMPQTRMATAAVIRDAFVKAQNYMRKMDNPDPEKRPDRDLKMETLVKALKREIIVKAHAHRSDDILTAVRIAREFNLNMTLEHCTEGYLIIDRLAQAGLPITLGPLLSDRSKPELSNMTFAAPACFERAGIDVALMTDSPVIPEQYLAVEAAICVRNGLSEEGALKAITINAAKAIGLADRVGSLEVGKDADVVIWNGNPVTDITATVYRTIVDGNVVYCQGDK